MKNLNKVRKKRVNWFLILQKVWDEDMKNHYFKLLTKHRPNRRRSDHLSQNRCAYNTLKHYYSTTTTKELLEKICYVL